VVYIVEDDLAIRELVIYSLKNSGIECQGFVDGNDFFAAMSAAKPSLIILDIMLPCDDGLSILKKIREAKTTADIPVIMLTAKGTEYDKVMGFENGADDYVTKPFGIMELIARVKRLIKRTKKTSSDQNNLLFENIEVDIPKHLVFVGGQEVILTIKEFDTLVFLLRSRNIVHSRETILTEVWGYDYAMETRTVDAHIMSLRKKMGDGGKYVHTVRGVGYKIGSPE
jgi:two-component system alkaline phosphatase synthesis response regulator PhoP